MLPDSTERMAKTDSDEGKMKVIDDKNMKFNLSVIRLF